MIAAHEVCPGCVGANILLVQGVHSQQVEVSSGFNNGQSLQLLSSPLKAADRVHVGREGSPHASPEIKVILSGRCADRVQYSTPNMTIYYRCSQVLFVFIAFSFVY